MDSHLPKRTGNDKLKKGFRPHKPYWTEELTSLWKAAHSKELVVRKNKCNGKAKKLAQANFKEARNVFDRKLRQAERKYRREQIIKIETLNTNNPREFWKEIRQLGPRSKHGLPDAVRIGDNLEYDCNVVKDKWKNDFSNLYNRPEDILQGFNTAFYETVMDEKESLEDQNNNVERNESNSMLNKEIEFGEIECVINKLKNRKACGIDNVPNEMLKCMSIKMLLYELFRICFDSCIMPTIWLKSIISPIPKSAQRDPYVPLNYRGISLLSNIYKIYSAILNNRLCKYFETLNLMSEEQNGFRKGRSCLDHAYVLTSVIRKRIDKGENTFVAFVDMEKAFDWVDRDLMYYKLLSYNVDGKFYNVIRSLYSAPVAALRLNHNVLTDWFCTSSGVKQGDNLSPTLFNIFLNDLSQEINSLNKGINLDGYFLSILLYADDIALIAGSEVDLQCMLDKLYDFCQRWRLKINTAKTNIVHFRKVRKARTTFNFTLGDNPLCIVSKYKYLGLYLDEFLKFDDGIGLLCDSAGRALGSVISKFKTLKNVGYHTFTKLYASSVIPISDYFSGIWSHSKSKAINKVQNRAMRYFLGVPSKTPILAMQGDIGWMSSKGRHTLETVRLWNRLVKMNHDRLTWKVFQYDIAHDECGWARDVKFMFENYGFDNHFQEQMVCDVNAFKDKIMVHDQEVWLSSIPSKPKLRTYRTFKTVLKPEVYVTSNSNRTKRSLFAQLRAGVLPLAIETGRYKKSDVQDRICLFCDSKCVEDEIHFICSCSLYNEIRSEVFGSAIISQHDTFTHLMSTKQNEVLNYLNRAWFKRSDSLIKKN